MPHSFQKFLTKIKETSFSGQAQLNVIGVTLLILIALSLWDMARQFTLITSIPMIFLIYAAFRIIWELTWNRANVPTLATGYAGRGKMMEILAQEAKKNPNTPYQIIDLGSGRGELTRHLAKAIPSAQVLGIEISKIPFWQSRFVQRWFGPKNLSYQCLDFWPYDCAAIDAVVFYLTPSFAQKIGEKLHREMKTGSMVISHTFPLLGAWTPIEVVEFRTPFKETIYVYRKD